MIVLLLLAVVTATAMLMRPSPLAVRLVGAWELTSTPSGTSDRRTMEFDDDGRFWIYRRGERNVEIDTYRWRVSQGDLVVVFEDPLAQGGPPGVVLREVARRTVDPKNVARSYRYAVKDNGDSLSLLLIEERGNPPAQVESATLTREPVQP
jgi:hypothetical protein